MPRFTASLAWIINFHAATNPHVMFWARNCGHHMHFHICFFAIIWSSRNIPHASIEFIFITILVIPILWWKVFLHCLRDRFQKMLPNFLLIFLLQADYLFSFHFHSSRFCDWCRKFTFFWRLFASFRVTFCNSAFSINSWIFQIWMFYRVWASWWRSCVVRCVSSCLFICMLFALSTYALFLFRLLTLSLNVFSVLKLKLVSYKVKV